MEKIPYVPSETKRFEISKDPDSLKRLQFVRDLHSDLLQSVPFDIGCVLAGSLSKGKKLTTETASNSDIDLFFFLDRESVIDNFSDPAMPQDILRTYWFMAGRLDLFMKMSNPDLVLPEIDYSNWKDDDEIKIKAARKFLTSQVKRTLSESQKKYQSFIKIDDEMTFIPISISGKDSLYDYARLKYPEEAHSRLGILDDRLPLAWAFGLDVGRNMKKYRTAFIDQLSQLPSVEAHNIWNVVNESVRFWERKGEVPANLDDQFPSTFEKAKAYYKIRS